jgi:hypothetical protein
VLWLDELQRYLDAGLTEDATRTLINAGVVIVATLWPGEYTIRTAARLPGEPDPHADARNIIRLAWVIDVPDAFTETELNRAALAARSDLRLRTALDSTDAGLTQVLAAGPELVRRWENAGESYGKAVITAALDARRVGAHAPLSEQFFSDAAPAYLNTQRARAPENWLSSALAYASTLLQGEQ